jgi:hypothetical protein
MKYLICLLQVAACISIAAAKAAGDCGCTDVAPSEDYSCKVETCPSKEVVACVKQI